MKQFFLHARATSGSLLVGALLCSGCSEFPKDPGKTLEKVENGVLVVGYSENPPWVVKTNQAPTGIEPTLVEAFARSLHARVQWRNDTEQQLFEALQEKKVDLVVAGLTDDNPWQKEQVGFTRPYFELGKRKHVMVTIQGENAFIVRLEKFLHQHKATIPTRVRP